ncbi:hypothetical protein D3C71_1725160 [compost metagenome]
MSEADALARLCLASATVVCCTSSAHRRSSCGHPADLPPQQIHEPGNGWPIGAAETAESAESAGIRHFTGTKEAR